jgi:hypothetical protein
MLDPLSDPRARDLLSAAPEEVSALAGDFHSAADESRMTATGLSAAQHDAAWTGRAADAFRRAIGLLPGELARVHDGFRAVAVALDGYEGELAPIRARFTDAEYQLSEARTALGPARATQEAARRAWSALLRSGTAFGAAQLEAEQAVAGADAAVRGLETEVAQNQKRLLLAERALSTSTVGPADFPS